MNERATFIVFRTTEWDCIHRGITSPNIDAVAPRPCEEAELVDVERLYCRHYGYPIGKEFIRHTEKQWIVRLTINELMGLTTQGRDGVVIHPFDLNADSDDDLIFWHEGKRIPVIEIYDGYRE